MINRIIDDQYCIRKINSFLDYDLKKISFSDSNLNYLSDPLNSIKVNNQTKLKYLNCFRVSFKIYEFNKLKQKFKIHKMNYLQSISYQNLNSAVSTDLANKSNLSINKQLTQSDPELYLTNLFDYVNETKEKQLFFLKFIYSLFKSLNFFRNFHFLKGANFFTIKPEFRRSNDKLINEIVKFENSSDFKKSANDKISSDKKILDKKRIENDFKYIEDLDNIEIDKVVSCVDTAEPFSIDSTQDAKMKKNLTILEIDPSISNLRKDELYKFLDLNEDQMEIFFKKIESLKDLNESNKTQKILKKCSSLSSPSSNYMNQMCKKMKPIKSIDESSIQRRKLFSKRDSPQADHKVDYNDMDVIDLNDVNNFKFYDEIFFDSFNWNEKEQEHISSEFEKKFEAFLKEDFRNVNKPMYKKESDERSIKERDKENYLNEIDNQMEKKDKNEFLNNFKSKIPVLKRDKTKLIKSISDKLNIDTDEPIDLIDTLNEEYMLNRLKIKNSNSNENSKKRTLKPIKDQFEINESKQLNQKNILLNQNFQLSRIPKFVYDESNNRKQFLIDRKKLYDTKSRMPKKSSKFDSVRDTSVLKNLKESKGRLDVRKEKDEIDLDKNELRIDNSETNQNLADKISEEPKYEFQYLKKCVPRTKSESFINEQIDCDRINENYRQRLLDLEFKANGNCLFQLYDYFDNFKDKYTKKSNPN